MRDCLPDPDHVCPVCGNTAEPRTLLRQRVALLGQIARYDLHFLACDICGLVFEPRPYNTRKAYEEREEEMTRLACRQDDD